MVSPLSSSLNAGTNNEPQAELDSSITPSFSHRSICACRVFSCLGFNGLSRCFTGLASFFSSLSNWTRSVVLIWQSGAANTSAYSRMTLIISCFNPELSCNNPFSLGFQQYLFSSLFLQVPPHFAWVFSHLLLLLFSHHSILLFCC